MRMRALRRRVALWLCPELGAAPIAPVPAPAPERADNRQALITLADAWARHDGVTHWAISMRVTSKGDFFKRLIDGKDCQTRTAQRVIAAMDARWPEGLSWPVDIPRPGASGAQRKRRAAQAEGGVTAPAKRRAPARKMLAFSVRAETHAWLARLARDAGDADAEACAGALIERLAAGDMAAHGAAESAGAGAAERDIG